MSQPKLKDLLKPNDAAAADLVVAKWDLTQNITPNVMKGTFWKRMNQKLTRVSATRVFCSGCISGLDLARVSV